MARLGRFSVSASLLAALLALPCVCSAAEYEEPTQLCHDLAESAYQLSVARNDPFPDAAYERAQADCEFVAWRAFMVADSSVSLNELVAFDQDDESSDVEAGWL